MPRKKIEEVPALYILHNPDGSVRAELEMTQSEAAKINAKLEKAGKIPARWIRSKDTTTLGDKVYSMLSQTHNYGLVGGDGVEFTGSLLAKL